jgi:uncharacterized PurR-regulated membrane protein YhhQ (DUF165 family)
VKYALVVLYGLCVVAANWLILHFGLVPVGFGLMAPAGVYAAACTLVLRDLVQRTWGKWVSLAVIVPAAGITALMSPQLALASGTAFVLAELLDFAVYTPLAKKIGRAVLASVAAGAVLDSVVFLQLAHIPLGVALPGLLLGKVYVAIVASLALHATRARVPQRQAA